MKNRRNKHYLFLKNARMLNFKHSDLRNEDDYDWVPVEKPQFIGWELSLKLDDMGSRNPYAHDIYEVLNIVCARPVFTKDLNTIKNVRKANKRLVTYMSIINEIRRKNKYANLGITDLFDHRLLTKDKYEQLPDRLKKYFSEYTDFRFSFGEKTLYSYYKLSYTFPFNRMEIVIKKAYSNFKGIPRSEKISEEKKLQDKIWDTEIGRKYFSTKNGFSSGRDNSYRKISIRNNRKQWSCAIKKVINQNNCLDDNVEDVLTLAEKYTTKKIKNI